MTKEEGKEFANALKNNYTIDFDKLPEFCDLVISALSENKTQMIDKSNFDVEQYKADLQCAYDCGYNKALSENKCFDGMTNGEAIQALFDGLVIHDNPAKQKYTIPMTYEFWNAPYQKGGE